ncbi:MAG: hypothetical protein ACK40O_00930 [Allosphingosinicella sp.]
MTLTLALALASLAFAVVGFGIAVVALVLIVRVLREIVPVRISVAPSAEFAEFARKLAQVMSGPRP